MRPWAFAHSHSLRHFLLVMLLAVQTPFALLAVQPVDGYFAGTELQPTGSASIETVETEPAVALIFALDQGTADVTQQFNEWYLSTSRPPINAFAIAVDTGGRSQDVVLEAINQRNLSVPVFLASADLLNGDAFRLFVLNNGSVTDRFSIIDAASINVAAERVGVSAPEETPPPVEPPPQTTPSITEPPVAAPEQNVVVTTESVTRTVTTESEPEESAKLEGGKTSDNLYANELYGMEVEFPPGWRYQVAAREDGAVAVKPVGSKMDMRIWALPADGVTDPQQYVDQRLESLAQKHATRVNIDRRFEVIENGKQGLDISYNYALPLDPDLPARGLLLYRGRMQVFVHDGYIKAAGVEAPAGEFTATTPMIESYFRSFQVQPAEVNSPLL